MTTLLKSSLRRWLGVVSLGAGAFLGGCVVAPVGPGYAGYSYTTYGSPPAAQYEVVPVAPSAAYVWTPGIWLWGGSRYNWRPGYWGPRGGYGYGRGGRGFRGHR